MKALDYLQLLVLAAIHVAKGAFIEIPKSQTVSVGETADFRCTHATADNILWRINGSLVSIRQLPPGITISASSEGSILTVIGQSEYDGTEVVCVATFFNGAPDDTTDPPAMLRVVMTPSETDMVSGTRFIEEPLSLNVTIDEVAVFRCEHRSADATFWRINGTSLSSRPDLHDDFINNNNGRFNTLTVTALSKYNATTVHCVALFDSDTIQPVLTAPALLQIQGSLRDANELMKQNSTLSWEAPFSLNLTNIEPDIVYCVEVYNITCGGRELLITDCDVTETSYTSDVIAPDGYIYEYIVTPRSNVEGAINGTPSQPLRDNLPTFTGSSTRLSVGNFDSNVRAYQTELMYTPNRGVPESYSLSLQSLDGLEDKDHVETTATIEPSVLTLEVVSGLPFRRLWNCSVLAYGCKENNIMNEELSTHDFRDILSSSLHPGEVRVTGSFTDDSTATGVLVIVIGDSEVIYHKASRDGTDKIKETLITGLAGGNYSISVFVVEENGLPFERVATSPKLVAVETNDFMTPSSSSIEYSLQSTSTGVCITCTFLDNSATDCVAVVHQRISQLNSSGLMNIESSHKLTRSNDTASGCIEGVNIEDYQVGVVGGRQVTIVSAESSCAVCVSVGSVVTVVLVLLTLVVLVMIVFVCKRSQQKRMGHLRVHIRSGSPTSTNYHDTESGHGNEYEKCPLDNKEEITVVTESTPPPLYSEIASQEAESESAIGHYQTSAPVVPHGNQPVYAEALSIKVNAVAAPPVVDRQEYDQVAGFKYQEGLHYAILGGNTEPQKTPLDIRDRVVYSELVLQAIKDVVVDDSDEKDNYPQLDTPNPTPFTSSNLFTLLRPVVSKWKQLAEPLSVDEDDIDDIFTNNETDEACLCDLLDRFITVHHNWADVERALTKMGEEHLAERASKLYVLPKVASPETEAESESAVGHHQTSAAVVPHVPRRAHTVDQSLPVYVEAFTTQVNAVAAPPVVEKTEYVQVTGFKNPEGLHYAIIDRKTKPQKTPLDNDMPQVRQEVVGDDFNENDNHSQLVGDSDQRNASHDYYVPSNAVLKSDQFARFYSELGTDKLQPSIQNSDQLEQTDDNDQIVDIHMPLYQPAVQVSKVPLIDCSEDPIEKNVIGSNSLLPTTDTSPTSIGTKVIHTGEKSFIISEDETLREKENDSYLLMVIPSLTISRYVQMTKEEQKRLLHCNLVSRDGLWQAKASQMSKGHDHILHWWLAHRKVSAESRVWKRPPKQRMSSVNRACRLQGWMSDLHSTSLRSVKAFCLKQLQLDFN